MGPLSVLSVTLVYCDPTDGWIKMPLGTEVGLCQGDMVLDGDPAPPRKSSHFSAYVYCLLWPYDRPSQQLLSSLLCNWKSVLDVELG